MSRYALVIFDFDGTLADSAPWFASVINEVARRYRFREVQEGERERLRGMDVAAICKHLGLPRWKLPFVARHMRKLAARDIDRIRPFPGIDRCLAELRDAGLRLAIVSSNAQANIEAVLGHGTARLIEHYACGAATFGKAAKFRQVLKRMKIAPGDAIAIGDEGRDLDAAAEAGIAAAAVTWGYSSAAPLEARRPTMMLRRVEDIVAGILGAADRTPPLSRKFNRTNKRA